MSLEKLKSHQHDPASMACPLTIDTETVLNLKFCINSNPLHRLTRHKKQDRV